MQYTTNYNLKKPESNDTANINDLNENMDIIDEKLKEAIQNEQLQGDVTEIKGTTEEIKTSVGSSVDLSSSPTLFGRLAEIKETLTSKFSEVVSKITGVDEKIGISGDSGTDTVFGLLKTLSNKGAIKGVQVGYTTNINDKNTSIPISTINPDKSIVLINGWGRDSSSSYNYHPMYLIEVKNNSFTVRCDFRYDTFLSWQVIEFY